MEIELGHDILLERFMGAPLQEGKMPLAKTTGIATGRAQDKFVWHTRPENAEVAITPCKPAQIH
jgi:hypothetical protein